MPCSIEGIHLVKNKVVQNEKRIQKNKKELQGFMYSNSMTNFTGIFHQA